MDGFEKPKITLEQYPTSAHIASHMLYTAQTQYGDIENCAVADFGCGCGVLALGAQMLNASHVVGFEIDSDALSVLYRNCTDLDLFVESIQCDILQYLPGMPKSIFSYIKITLYKLTFNIIYCRKV